MGRTALVVDDAMSIRQMVAYTLTQAGFEVVEAANGREALERLEARRVDIVITDLHMPVMDGISFIREMRTKQATRFTPALLLTTESQAEKKQEGKAAGATGWIVKPFHPEKLIEVIGRVLP
jgi:two-component system chemotaxis response regulator CheY